MVYVSVSIKRFCRSSIKLRLGRSFIAHWKNYKVDLDDWLKFYNTERTHQGKMCCGRTPLETLLDGKRIWAEKNLAQI